MWLVEKLFQVGRCLSLSVSIENSIAQFVCRFGSRIFRFSFSQIKYTEGGSENLELARVYFAQACHLNPNNLRSLLGLLLVSFLWRELVFISLFFFVQRLSCKKISPFFICEDLFSGMYESTSVLPLRPVDLHSSLHSILSNLSTQHNFLPNHVIAKAICSPFLPFVFLPWELSRCGNNLQNACFVV